MVPEYDLDPLEKNRYHRKRFDAAAQEPAQRAAARLQRRLDRASSEHDITALVEEAATATRAVVLGALAGSGLTEKQPRASSERVQSADTRRGLESQAWWGQKLYLPWLAMRERATRWERAEAQADCRRDAEAALGDGRPTLGLPRPRGQALTSYAVAAQNVHPKFTDHLAAATSRWREAQEQLRASCAAARLQYYAQMAGKLMGIRTCSTRSFFRSVKRVSSPTAGGGIPFLRDPAAGGALTTCLRRNAILWRDHFAALGVEKLPPNASLRIIRSAQAGEQRRQTAEYERRNAYVQERGGLATLVRADVNDAQRGSYARTSATAVERASVTPVSAQDDEADESQSDGEAEDERLRGVPRKVEPEDLDSPFEMAEAKRALKHLRPGGAHGGDNVPPECKYLTKAFIYLQDVVHAAAMVVG